MKTIEPVALCALVFCVALSGCASTPPELHDYLLRPQKLEVVSGSRSAVVLKPVAVAPYLDQQGIVLQTSPGEIHVARHHQWAEPLDDAIGRYLQVVVGNRASVQVQMGALTTGNANRTVTARINQLHGDAQGEVRLVADWVVESEEGEPRLFIFDEQLRQSTDGYSSLVAAHADLLDQLATAIADSLQ